MLPLTEADISVATDGDILIVVEQAGLDEKSDITVRRTEVGVQVFNGNTLTLDLNIPLSDLREKLKTVKIIVLAQVSDGGDIQVFDNLKIE